MTKIALTNETTYYPDCGCCAYPEYEEVGTVEVTGEQLELIKMTLDEDYKAYTQDSGIPGEDIRFTSFVEVD